MIKKLDELYYEVESLINKIDFNKIWPNFKRLKFALYNQNECFFNGNYIPKTNQFLGNTSIKYNDEYIAIWNVIENIEPKILASKMIHEMFHGFQYINNESRFPDEIKSIYEYKYIDENLSIKLKENEIINDLLSVFNQSKFNELLNLRKYRSVKFNTEFTYEVMIEQIEGTANYIELNVLYQLDNELYNDKLNALKKAIVNPNRLIPIRIISYDIGVLFIKLLMDYQINFDKGFSHIPIAQELIEDSVFNDLKINNNMQVVIDSYYQRGLKIINDSIDHNDIIMDGYEDLLGFNVYNAFFKDGYIISRYFVMYGSKENPSILYGDFVIESKEKGKVTKIYKLKS